ncbi:MAG: RNA methyltransferase [Phycisphaerae bacterium]|nr:RNA methyltransferase [Phycisphaerae bacterium]
MEAQVITSLQNPRIKAVVKLRDRHGRGRRACIMIDGRREVGRAVDMGVRIQEVFYCRTLLRHDDDRRILRSAEDRGARLAEVSEAVFAKICYGERAEGIVATATRPETGLRDLPLSECPIICVVERVEKPGNLGAVLRSADGAGVEAILAADPVTDIYGPNVIRSSLGAVFSVPLVEVSAEEAIEWLLGEQIAVVAAVPDAERAFTEVDLSGPVAVVFGSEATGLTSAWKRAGVIRASVPMLGMADSLNVSITAALFFYEAVRQRRGRQA